MNLHWFNLHPEFIYTFGARWKLFNAFNRVSEDGHFWGFGILQIYGRHLLYVGHDQAWVLFTRAWQQQPA